MNDTSENKHNNDGCGRRKKRRFDEDIDQTKYAAPSNAYAMDDGFLEVPYRVKSKGNDQPNTTESIATVTSSHPKIPKQHKSTESLYDDVTLETAKILLQLKLTIPKNLSYSNYTTKISWSHSPIKPVLNNNIDDKVNVSISAPICAVSSGHNSNSSNMPSSSETCIEMRLNNYQRSNCDKRNIGDLKPETLSSAKLKTLQRGPQESQMDHPPHGSPEPRRRTLLSPSELEEANRNEAVRLYMVARNRTMQNLNELALDVMPSSSEIDRPRSTVASITHSTIHNINDSIAGSLRPTSLRRRGLSTFEERISQLRNSQFFEESNITNAPPPYQRTQSVPLTRNLINPNSNFAMSPNLGSLRLNQSSQVTHNQQSDYIHPMLRSQIEEAVSHNIGNQNLNLSSDANSFYNRSAATHATEIGSHLGNYINQQTNYALTINDQTTPLAQPNLYLNDQVSPQFDLPSYPISGHSVNHMGNEHVNQQFNLSNDLNQARLIYDERQRSRHSVSNPELPRYPYPADFMFNNSEPTIHSSIDQSRSLPRPEQFSHFTDQHLPPIPPPSEHRFRVPQVPPLRTKTSRPRNKSVKKAPSCKPSNSKFMREARGLPKHPPETETSQHALYPQTMTLPVISTVTCATENEVTTTMCSTATMIDEPETPVSKEEEQLFLVSIPKNSAIAKEWQKLRDMSTTTTMAGTSEPTISITEVQPVTPTMSSLNDIAAMMYSTPQASPLVDSISTALSTTTKITDAQETSSTALSTTTTITDAQETSVSITEEQQRIFTPDLVQTPNDVATTLGCISETTPVSTPSLLHLQNMTFPVSTVMMHGPETPVIVPSTNNNAVTLILTPETSSIPVTAQSTTVSPAVMHSQNSAVAITATVALTTVLHPSNTRLLITVAQPNALHQRYVTPHITVMENPPSTRKEQSNALAHRLISPHISVIQTPQNPPPMSQISISATQSNTLLHSETLLPISQISISATQSNTLPPSETLPPMPPFETLPPMPPLIEIPWHLIHSKRSTRPQVPTPQSRSTSNLAPAQAHVPKVAQTTEASSKFSSQYSRLYNRNLYLPTIPYSVRPDFYTPQRRYLPRMMQNRQPLHQTVPEKDTQETNRQPLHQTAPEKDTQETNKHPLYQTAPDEDTQETNIQPLHQTTPEEDTQETNRQPLHQTAPEEDTQETNIQPLYQTALEEDTQDTNRQPLHQPAPEEDTPETNRQPLHQTAPEEDTQETNRQPLHQTTPEEDTKETNRQNADVPDNANF